MPESMNVSIEAVYAIVSVPCVMTTPEKPSRIVYTHSAMYCHSSG